MYFWVLVPMCTFDKLLLQQLRLLDSTQSQEVYCHMRLLEVVANVHCKENLLDIINSDLNFDTAYKDFSFSTFDYDDSRQIGLTFIGTEKISDNLLLSLNQNNSNISI